jgi:hypothetical protein
MRPITDISGKNDKLTASHKGVCSMKLATSPFVSHFPEFIVTAITIYIINSNTALPAPSDKWIMNRV